MTIRQAQSSLEKIKDNLQVVCEVDFTSIFDSERLDAHDGESVPSSANARPL
jgi:hypothetical protein